jgi:general secretion pathway protein B
MSYILDALQKSERQRKNQAAPELTASQGPTPPPRRWRPWLAVTSILVLLNVAGVWLWLQTNPGTEAATASQVSNAAVTTVAPNTASLATAAGRSPGLERSPVPNPQPASSAAYSAPPALAPPAMVSLNPVAAPTVFNPAAQQQAPPAVDINELPRDIQRQIPDLLISSHLYSDDFRLVNINGRMMREGEYIGTELKLEEITEDGVIISFQNYRMTLRVIQDWAYEP